MRFLNARESVNDTWINIETSLSKTFNPVKFTGFFNRIKDRLLLPYM